MAEEILRKSFTGIELKKDKPGMFLARFAKLNIPDKQGDVTLPGAAPNGKKVLLSAYMHGSWEGALPIGAGVIQEKGDELLFEGEINLNMESGKEHYEFMKNTPELVEFSYGFKVLELDDKSEWNDNPRVWRVFKKLDIFEVSPVLRGAGVDTGLLGIKSDKNQGLTMKEQADTALAAVDGLVSRMKSLADLKRKEGRNLSNASRDEISRLEKRLGEMEQQIKGLLEEPIEAAAAAISDGIRSELNRSLKAIKNIYGGN